MKSTEVPICRWRFSLLVLIGVYPLVTLLSYALESLTVEWPIWQRCLIVAPVMVGAMVFGLIPAIHARFDRFIRPDRSVPLFNVRNRT